MRDKEIDGHTENAGERERVRVKKNQSLRMNFHFYYKNALEKEHTPKQNHNGKLKLNENNHV